MLIRSGYLIAGAGLGRLVALIARHGVSARPKYLLRLAPLLLGGLWTSLLAPLGWLARIAARHPRGAAADPIFVVGHWRCGSTYLHQLLALDPRLAAPTTLQCSAPGAYPVSRLLLAPFMLLFSRGRRPMDRVRIGPGTPQEDEFALFRLTGLSPLARLVFPRRERYFLAGDETFLPADARERARWIAALEWFVALVRGRRGRRPVLKNPFHTLRIELLARRFPGAAFVHLRRSPLEVIPSTLHLWSILGAQNRLRREWRPPRIDEVIEVYDLLERRACASLAGLPPGRRVTVGFAALERDPLGALERIYARLDLPVDDGLRARWAAHVAANRGYRKNRYQLSADAEQLIRTRLAAHLDAGASRVDDPPPSSTPATPPGSAPA